MRAPKVVGSIRKNYPTRSVATLYCPKSDKTHDLDYKIAHCLNARQQELIARPVVVKSAVLALFKVANFNLDEVLEKYIGEPTEDLLKLLNELNPRLY